MKNNLWYGLDIWAHTQMLATGWWTLPKLFPYRGRNPDIGLSRCLIVSVSRPTRELAENLRSWSIFFCNLHYEVSAFSVTFCLYINYVTRISWFFYPSPSLSQVVTFLRPTHLVWRHIFCNFTTRNYFKIIFIFI